MLSPKMFFISTLKGVLTLWCVLVDQSLVALIFAQRIPYRIELETRNGDSVWNNEQVIKQAKCFIRFAGPRVNLRKHNSHVRPIESVLRFRQQLNCALALCDCRILLTESG